MVPTRKLFFMSFKMLVTESKWLSILFLIGCSHIGSKDPNLPAQDRPVDAEPSTLNNAQGQSNMAVWRSANATPEQRARAINELISVGTRGRDVQEILGNGGTWVRYAGPLINLYDYTEAANHGEWHLQYDVPGGKVALIFQYDPKVLPTDSGFLRASVLRVGRTRPSTEQSHGR
jgi:hypothetical protein